MPKTGGTSVRNELKNYARRIENNLFTKMLRRMPYVERNSLFYDFYNRPHTTCWKAKKLLNDEYDKCLSFGIIRNPFEWVVSSYRHFMSNYRHIIINEESHKVRSFDEYVELLSYVDYTKIPCQHKLIVDREGGLIVNILGEFSEIDQFTYTISSMLNIDKILLPHLNKNLKRERLDEKVNKTTYHKIEYIWNFDFSLWDFYQSNKKNCYTNCRNQMIAETDLRLDQYDPWKIFK